MALVLSFQKLSAILHHLSQLQSLVFTAVRANAELLSRGFVWVGIYPSRPGAPTAIPLTHFQSLRCRVTRIGREVERVGAVPIRV